MQKAEEVHFVSAVWASANPSWCVVPQTCSLVMYLQLWVDTVITDQQEMCHTEIDLENWIHLKFICLSMFNNTTDCLQTPRTHIYAVNLQVHGVTEVEMLDIDKGKILG